jgi:hypothetical protein
MRHVTTQTSFYTDPDLADWGALTMFFYRYLYENDHVDGIMGVGRIAEPTILTETRMTPRQLKLAREQIGARVVWFTDGSYWVVGRIKHTCYFGRDGKPSPKHLAAFRNRLADLSQPIRSAILARYPIDTLSIPNRPVPDLPTVSVSVSVSESVKRQRTLVNAAETTPHSPDTASDTAPQPQNGPTTPTEATEDNEGTEKAPQVPYRDVAKWWNELAAKHGLPRIGALSALRKAKVRSRWATWTAESAPWQVLGQIGEAIAKSTFLREGSGDRPWRVRFDWLFVNDGNWRKVVEGTYADEGRGPHLSPEEMQRFLEGGDAQG